MHCGLLGEHLAHSYSPQIHRQLGTYSYALFEIAPDALSEFLNEGAFDALNVTIPYKRAVIPYCAELSDTARRIGSVNTLLRRPDGSLYGDNTDYDGFAFLLSRNGGIAPGAEALVLGSGGASQTVQAVLRDCKAKVIVISRSGENKYDTLAEHSNAQLLVNTTPVGMYPHNGESPIDLSVLPNCNCVLDLIYNPLRTRLLMDAQARGIRCEGGLPMLVAQAKRAAELFTGSQIPDNREILARLHKQMCNIILIGMPGCGKSTVGAQLAAQCGRTFFDADALLAAQTGCSVPAFLSQYGEDTFRALETRVLSELGSKSGCIIATGGGCVTRDENYPLLHQNGTIIFLQRQINLLPTTGRPISQNTDLQTLYAARRPSYEHFADYVVNNDGPTQRAVDEIMELVR